MTSPRDPSAAPVAGGDGKRTRGDGAAAGSRVDGASAGSRGGGAPVWPRGEVVDRALRIAMVAIVVGLGVIGLALSGSVLRGGVAWWAFLLFVLSGWGHLVARVARARDADFGLRAAWGIAGYLAVAGALVAFDACSRPVILVLIALGVVGFAARELTVPVASWQHVVAAARWCRGQPALASLVGLLAAVAAVQIVGAIGALDRNPWDDDIAYTPMIARLLDAGDLIEPFSFRRLGAYGGQTALGALAGARDTLANVHLVDKALCFAIALLIVVAKAREHRTNPLCTVLIVLVLLLLPDIAINTAAQWAGVAMFLALYRAVEREDWALAGLVGAAACTLRQNYIVVVVLFVAIVIARGGLAKARPRLQLVAIVAFASIVGWWIGAYRSSGTFLFPFIGGTWNDNISVTPEALTWAQELYFFVWACIETQPIVVVPVLFALLVFTDDARDGRPLRSLWIASTLGFIVLAHSFAGTDPVHLWRYAFGFAIALTAIFVIEAGAEGSVVRVPALGRWLLLVVLALQLLSTRDRLPKRYAAMIADLREAAAIDRSGDPSARVEAARYVAMQRAIPAGARVAVMLDDAAYLDFARNSIANLDTPGFASPGALPAFHGAEPLRSYFIDGGYRYVAFVRSHRSRYFYRREFWLWRIFNDGELFQTMSAYAIDMIESLEELSTTTKVLYDADGLVVLDLATPLRAATTRLDPDAESVRRDRWFRDLAAREGLIAAWSLTSRRNIHFEDGIGPLQFVEGAIGDPAWFAAQPPREPGDLRDSPVRPLYRRAHLRVRGDADMRLVMRVAVALETVHTRPRLDVSLDGDLLTSAIADDRGRYLIEVVVPRARIADGWHDLYLVFNSVAEPGADPRDLRVARLESVHWAPVEHFP